MPEIILKFKKGESCDACPCFEYEERIVCRIFNKEPEIIKHEIPGNMYNLDKFLRLPECIAKFGEGE